MEIAFARVVPGTLQILSIAFVARYLTVSDYGMFSTGLETTAFLALICTGSIRFSIIPQHAAFAAIGEGATFERNLVGLLLLASLIVLFGGGVLSWTGLTDPPWVALAVSSALFFGWSPVMQARLQFWRYGLATMAQAMLLMALLQYFLPAYPKISTAGWAFAASYGIGFIVGWLLCGAPMPRLPKSDTRRSIIGVGSSFTVANLAENGLYLGSRYAILWLGSPEFLSQFSFAVDMAQRSVGVVINIATFALVPRAYRSYAKGAASDAEFRAILMRGVMVSVLISALIMVMILLVEAFGLMDRFVAEAFSVVAFCSVSIAIVLNRVKKLAFDPVAVVAKKQWAIPMAYAAIAPPALAASLLVCFLGEETMMLIIYPLAYLVTTVLTAALLRRRNGAQHDRQDGSSSE